MLLSHHGKVYGLNCHTIITTDPTFLAMITLTLSEFAELTPKQQKALGKVCKNGYALKELSESLRDDRIVVMEAVLRDKEAIYYASEKLKTDPDIIFTYCVDTSTNENVFSLKFLAKYINIAFEKSSENEIQHILKGLHTVLIKKDKSFLRASIDRLNQNDIKLHEAFSQSELDKSSDYAEYKKSSRDGLSYIIKILPKPLLSLKFETHWIQSMFNDEISRRKMLSIKSKNEPNTRVKRKTLPRF